MFTTRFEQNYWKQAFVISSTLHILILTGIPTWLSQGLFNKKDKPKFRDISNIALQIKNESYQQVTSKKIENPPYIEQNLDKLVKKPSFNSPKEKLPITIPINKEIIMVKKPIEKDAELKKIPAYMDYYKLIREEIKNKIYQYYQGEIEGEVILNFSVFKNGLLGNLSVQGNSTYNPNLRKIALYSIRNSAPFKEFPKELKDYNHLQFNIAIRFKK